MDSNILKKLKELGKMPNEDLYNDTQEIINLARKYEELLESIERPISLEDGYFLLSILPTEKFYGNEEVISSLIESIEVREKKVSIEEYKSLVNSCTNPYVKDFLDYGVEWLEEHISQFLQGKLSSLLKQLKIIITQGKTLPARRFGNTMCQGVLQQKLRMGIASPISTMLMAIAQRWKVVWVQSCNTPTMSGENACAQR